MKWIHIIDNKYKCPKCGMKFSINMQKPWKCCPVCEQELSGVEEQSVGDYIKREDAIRVVKESMYRHVAVDSVNRISSADVAEVKHGYWKQEQPQNRLYKCSACNKVCFAEMWGDETVLYDYCPNCGARMDGESNIDTEDE